ncbi:MAG: XdhC family protein [Dokdonella sp.]
MSATLPDTARAATIEMSALGGARALVAGLRELAARDEAGVLAVVVDSSGSTYRKPGALILVDAAGVRVGALSGGCLEAELEMHARAVLAHGVAGDVRFDTSGDEDRVFGSGTGCGGSTRVLLLPLPALSSPLRDALLDADARGLGTVLALSSTETGCGVASVGIARYAFDQRGARETAERAIIDAITLAIAPARRVLLLGAGPETRPLLAFTRLLGWYIELAEHRERWLRFAADNGVARLHRDGPELLVELLATSRFDAALVMNHNVHLDARCLGHLAASGVPYVGLLGPPARRDDLLAELGTEKTGQLRQRLHAPVGLSLGGEGAEAIALAIVAQLQCEFSRHARG